MRKITTIAVSLFVLAGGGEIFARYGLGLGTPPLSVAHPTIEYMFAPDQDVYRFHNRQLYNEYGMRSPAMNSITQPHRVMVFGDSVLNGGNLTDHAVLATTLATDDDTFFGNVSAGSWGPANIGAWIDEYGFLGAQTGVVVLSSHDLADLPTFAPLDPSTHPTRRPVSALLEGIERYLPRYLPTLTSPPPAPVPQAEDDTARGAAEIEALISRFAAQGVGLCLIQHQTRTELRDGPQPGHHAIQALFADRDVPTLDFGPVLEAALAAGAAPYRDDIHLSDEGQRLMVDALHTCAAEARVPERRPEENG